METLKAEDILDDGQAWGLRVRGGVADNSIDRTRTFRQIARGSDNRNSLRDPRDWNGSVAFAQRGEDWQLVAAYARRRQGNYFAGSNGAHRYDDQHLSSGGTGMSSQAVSKLYHPGDEVLNTHTENESALLKFTWTPNPDQRMELSHRFFNSSFGEIMPSAIGRVGESNEWVTYVDKANTMFQFEPGKMRVNATSLRHRYRPEAHPWLDLSSTLWFTTATSRMFNSNIANTPLFKDVPNDQMPDTLGETYGPGLQSDVKTRRWGLDSSNTTRFSNDLGDWTLRYGASFQHEDTAPNSPVLPVDYNNNRYLRSGTRREASVVASLQWQPWDWLSLTAGGRFIDYRTRDRNRVAFVSESRDLRYTFARLSKGGQLLPGWYKEWYPDAQGNYTYDSLRATPYGDSTLGQTYDFDGFIRDPRGANGFHTKQIPTAWGYKPAIRRSGHGFAPYAEARFNLDADMFFYVKYAQGWKMPSLFESTLGNSTSAPVADLKPEKNRSWDIGFSLLKQDLWRDGDRLAFKVAWFKNDIDNAITRRFDSSNWAFTSTMSTTTRCRATSCSPAMTPASPTWTCRPAITSARVPAMRPLPSACAKIRMRSGASWTPHRTAWTAASAPRSSTRRTRRSTQSTARWASACSTSGWIPASAAPTTVAPPMNWTSPGTPPARPACRTSTCRPRSMTSMRAGSSPRRPKWNWWSATCATPTTWTRWR